MKKCPYCAEEIQDEAIKCKHCMEFLDGRGRPALPTPASSMPFFFRTGSIVFSILAVGPLALPLVWFRPKTSLVWKLGMTVVILVLTWLMFVAFRYSWGVLKEYYQFMNDFKV